MKQEMTSATLKVIGLLLSYPSEEMAGAADDMRALLAGEAWISAGALKRIDGLLDALENSALLDLQESYVALFDRTPSLSLHLFEHVHGDSRDRGQAMVELDGLYRERGLCNASEHTPDYLPMFLEYLSMLPVEQARANLDGAIDVIAVLGERLRKRKSAYAVLFDALRDAASRQPDPDKLRGALMADAGDAPSREQMDAAWAEQFAFDGAPAAQGGGCPKAEEMLARMGVAELTKEKRT